MIYECVQYEFHSFPRFFHLTFLPPKAKKRIPHFINRATIKLKENKLIAGPSSWKSGWVWQSLACTKHQRSWTIDLLWDSFKTQCTAKHIKHVPLINPSGQPSMGNIWLALVHWLATSTRPQKLVNWLNCSKIGRITEKMKQPDTL